MRKSKYYFIASILCLAQLMLLCLVYQVPSCLFFNIIICVLIALGLIFYKMYQIHSNRETIIDSEKKIEELKKAYKDLNSIVTLYANITYNNLDSDFINNFHISINDSDNYLLDFENNIEQMKELDSEKLSSNDFIRIACIMDSLLSAWKLETVILSKDLLIEQLLIANCELAVSVSFYFLDLSYKDLKDDIYVKELVNLLATNYKEKQYGTIYTIECEKTVLELLYNVYHQ